MFNPVPVGKRTRYSYARIKEVMEMPHLLDIQRNSYQWFIDEGLDEILKDISPISDFTGNLELHFKSFAFGERTNNNSIMTAKLYGSYDNKSRQVEKDDVVDCRAVAYYSNMTAEKTNNFFSDMKMLNYTLPTGWNGVIVPDGNGPYGPDCTYYMLLSNFGGEQNCNLKGVYNRFGKPVFTNRTTINYNGSDASFSAEENHSVVNTLKFFINGSDLEAIQEKDNPNVIYLRNQVKGKNKLWIVANDDNLHLVKEVTLKTKVLKVSIVGGELLVEEAAESHNRDFL